MNESRIGDLVDASAHLAVGDRRAKTILRMVLVWLAVVVGFPVFYLLLEAGIGHMTLSPWELQHLTGPPWWHYSVNAGWFLALANIPSTVLITIASWRLTKEGVKYSFVRTFATACSVAIPPLAIIIMLVAFVYAASAVLFLWTIFMAPGIILLGIGIIGAYVVAIALWAHLCRRVCQ